jgi:cytochrome c oxidase subunit 2
MNTNRLFVRDLIGVVTAIAAVTTIALVVVPHHGTPAGAPLSVGGAKVARPLGARVYEAKGCNACHTVDGTPRIGPTFLHDWGTQIVLADGGTVTMDAAYIRESILEPQAKARPGYPPSMPSYAGMISEREIAAVTAYIASLR